MPQIILITGASSGFGAACAREFARKGCVLVLVARRLERLQALQQELAPAETYIAQLDVTAPKALEAVFDSLPEKCREIDVLINNAGLALGIEPAQEANFDDWQTMVDTNITGLLRVTRFFLPGMVKRNCGHIINIASTAASWPYPGGNTYGATKAFVQQFSRGLRADLLGTKLRVTTLSPGMAETEFSDVRFKQDKAKADAVYNNVQPLSAKDIADIIVWICSVPAHVNINSLEVMPVCQSWGPLAIHRE